MQRIDELIEKFWAGGLPEEEKQLLQELLTKHAHVLTDEMQAIFFAIRDGGSQVLDPERSRAIRERLDSLVAGTGVPVVPLTGVKKTVSLRRVWWAAAAVILVAGLLKILYRPAGEPLAVKSDGTGLPRHLSYSRNTSDTVQELQLADGSHVRLQGHSALSYYEPFYDSSRDISLTGAATFSVERDTKRPFTVYAGGIATTALGTVFTVNVRDTARISVLLLEGKVVVRPVKEMHSLEPVILDPGQEFTLNMATSSWAVHKQEGTVHTASAKADSSRDKADGHAGDVLLTFDNESLQSVLEKINRLYKTDIRWDIRDIEGLYFTGSVLKGDSIRTILLAIGNMNRLAFIDENGHIQVKKSH